MRAAVLGLSALLAVCAIPVGALLVVAPDGHLVGVSPRQLLVDSVPFTSLLLPGLILVLVVGGGALVVLGTQLLRAPVAAAVTAVYGVLLMGWIVVQLAMIRGVSVLHAVTFAIGAALVALGGARTWLRWVAANAVAALVGLGGVALGIWLLHGAPRAVIALAALALGAFAGLCAGVAQAQALRGWLPRLRAPAWVHGTVLGGMIAWAVAPLPSAFIDDPAAAAGLGAIAGPILAAFQLRELGRHVRGARWWLVANAVAWAAAMPFIFAAAGIVAGGGGLARAAALLAAAGGVAGLLHGLALWALVRRGAWFTSEGAPHGIEQHPDRRAALAGR
jgi:hypothetical protein